MTLTVGRMSWRGPAFGLLLAVFLFWLPAGCLVFGQEKTREEQLLEQVATLQIQLAQLSDRWAKCESNGAQSQQYQQAGQATAQELLKSLAARKLTLDKDGKVIQIPEPEKK